MTEENEVVAQLERIKNEVSAPIAEIKARLQEAEQKLDRRGASTGFASGMASSTIADLFTKSDQFQLLSKGATSTGRVSLGEIGVKALVNVDRGQDAGDHEFDVQPHRAAGLFGFAQRRLSLLDVLPTIPVTSGVFEYLSNDGYSNAAAIQEKEGDTKAKASVPTELIQAQIATIAHWTKASTQVLADAPALSQQVGNLMRYGLLAKLESELIVGAGGTGKIKGLTTHATVFTPSGVTTLNTTNKIGQAVTSLQSSGWQPGLILMHPNVWLGIVATVDLGGQYVFSEPTSLVPLSLWGVPVLLTPSISDQLAIVMDPQQAAILDRQEPTILASRDDDDNFRQNLVTILAEMRAGLAVFAPTAVLSVSLA